LDEKVKTALKFIKEQLKNYKNIAVPNSFGKDSMVVQHLVNQVAPNLPVIWLKPPFLPKETVEFAEKVIKDWKLNIIVAKSKREDNKQFMEDVVEMPMLWKSNPEACCSIFKVKPMKEEIAKHNFDAWFSGLRKTESDTRKNYDYIWKQGDFTRLHPILTFTEADIWRYTAVNKLPVNPLYKDGYRSLGCLKCSEPNHFELDERGGRWAGTEMAGGECLKPDAIVTNHSPVPINTISFGEKILDSTSDAVVIGRYKAEYSGEMIRIKGFGVQPIELTPNHKVFVYENRKSTKVSHITAEKITKENYLVIPRLKGIDETKILHLNTFTTEKGLQSAKRQNKPTEIPLTTEVAWLMGLYCAEGSSTNDKICFSLGKHETQLSHKLMNIVKDLRYSSYIHEVRTANNITFTSNILSKAFREWFGNGAANKTIPNFILLNSDTKILSAFLEGYWEGDGCEFMVGKNKDIFKKAASTVSMKLALQLQLLCARLKIFLSIRLYKSEKTAYIEGRVINQRNRYMIDYYPNPVHTFSKILEDKIITPIHKIEKTTYTGPVHNLQTTSGNYLVSNVCVNNCKIHCVPMRD